MSAIHKIDNDNQLIVTTWEGDASDIEFIEAIKEYQINIQSNPDYINYNEIVDCSKITKLKLTSSGIKTIGTIASSTDSENINKKLALIVSSNLAFGLARMYQAYRSFAKSANKEIRVFKNNDDAINWAKKQQSK